MSFLDLNVFAHPAIADIEKHLKNGPSDIKFVYSGDLDANLGSVIVVFRENLDLKHVSKELFMCNEYYDTEILKFEDEGVTWYEYHILVKSHKSKEELAAYLGGYFHVRIF